MPTVALLNLERNTFVNAFYKRVNVIPYNLKYDIYSVQLNE